jgi:hypothetical protein
MIAGLVIYMMNPGKVNKSFQIFIYIFSSYLLRLVSSKILKLYLIPESFQKEKQMTSPLYNNCLGENIQIQLLPKQIILKIGDNDHHKNYNKKSTANFFP